MSPSDRDEVLAREVVEGLRAIREAARRDPPPTEPPGKPLDPRAEAPPLPLLASAETPPPPASPDRDELNQVWEVSSALAEKPSGSLASLLAPLRSPLQRVARFVLGPLLERQVQMNSAQVRFDNEIVRYLDDRLDRMSGHYDRVLGLHGNRMEEIDERHRILQQELIRHVHDLVQRIEYVFEAAEQNHLYLEGMLRELREELVRLRDRLESPRTEKP